MRRLIPGLVLTGVVLAAGCAGSSSSTPTTPSTDAGGKEGGGGGVPPPPPRMPPIPPGAVPAYHQMDPANHKQANRPVFGSIRGRTFEPHVVLSGNRLVFRQGKKDASDVEVVIELPLAAGESPEGRHYVVHPEQKGDKDPKVTLKTRGSKEAAAQEKFAMTLSFGRRNKDGLAGNIQLCFPDEQKSYVVGDFEAGNE